MSVNTTRALTILLAGVATILAGCGGGDDGSLAPIVTTQILSDPAYDGDIAQPSSAPVTQGMSPSVQSVFAGIDPGTGIEFRAFLDFPLTGSRGVPADASIDSAFLDVYINDVEPNSGTLPILIELVSFQPPTLFASDFDRAAQPPLASLSVGRPITGAQIGHNVTIDVTPLMVQAQRLRLPDFQVRILEDLGSVIPVLMEINDTTGANRAALAPTLTVNYF